MWSGLGLLSTYVDRVDFPPLHPDQLNITNPPHFPRPSRHGCVVNLIYSQVPLFLDFPGGSVVKKLPAVQKTWVLSLGREDARGEGNGNPLQCSCLEDPVDRGAWGPQSIGSQRVRHDLVTEQLLLSPFVSKLLGALSLLK